MTRIHLRYVDRFLDRHGHVRHYFRRPGGKRLALPGMPGSNEFMAAYKAALAGEDVPPAEPKVRGEPGTFSRLAAQYLVSPDFLRLRTRTQHVYRLVIERFLAEHGHRRVVEMRRDDVKKIMALKAATPGSANDLLKKIRTLIKFAIDTGWRTDDPTLRIKTFPEHEFHTWTEDEIVQYEEHWPRAWPRKHMVMLTTAFNKPFTNAGYGNMMADAIGAAGLPDRCVLHGLRKAAARRLAEAGCSEKEISAVTGHTTLKEVARYTRAADQKRLAAEAVAKLAEQKPHKNSQPSRSGLGKTKKR